MLKIKKNDKVKIIKGKDRGKTGKVLRVESSKNRLYVEGINILKKHLRQKDQNKPGGILKKEGPINMPNVELVCPNCGKAARIGFKVKESGVKIRVCRKCKQEI